MTGLCLGSPQATALGLLGVRPDIGCFLKCPHVEGALAQTLGGWWVKERTFSTEARIQRKDRDGNQLPGGREYPRGPESAWRAREVAPWKDTVRGGSRAFHTRGLLRQHPAHGVPQGCCLSWACVRDSAFLLGKFIQQNLHHLTHFQVHDSVHPHFVLLCEPGSM